MIANKKEKGKFGNIQWVLNISTTTYWRKRLWNCDHEDCLVAKNSLISISLFCCWKTIQLFNFSHPSSVKFLLSYSVKFVVALTIFERLPKSFFWTDICWSHSRVETCHNVSHFFTRMPQGLHWTISTFKRHPSSLAIVSYDSWLLETVCTVCAL